MCRDAGIPLFVDGARLAYALAVADTNDVTLTDLARLADVFYIGGTKCGALMGEAVVVAEPSLLRHFTPLIKQRGALLAKGRLLGVQFGTLFTDGLYERLGREADRLAGVLAEALRQHGLPRSGGPGHQSDLFEIPNDDLPALAKVASFEEGRAGSPTTLW